MTDLQKIQSRLGAVRIRLSEIAGAELTEETRGELETLRIEYADLERRADAARMAGDASPDIPTTTETSEGKEFRDLRTRSNISDVFNHITGGGAITGAVAELQQHHGMLSSMIPLELLVRNWPTDGELETRAVTPAPSNVGQQQQSIIPFVFPDSAASFLMVDMPTVGVGEVVYPVLTSTLDVGTPAENDSQAETTGSFSADVLSLSRIQAAFYFSREDRARFSGLEESLRENLTAGLSDGFDQQILDGTNGLFNATVLPNHNVTTATTWDLYLSQLVYGRVDGTYASVSSDLKMVVGASVYGDMGATYRNASVDRTVLDRIMEITGGVKVSAHVPASANNRQNVVIKRGMTRSMTAPVWQGIELVEDNITKVALGQVVITAIMLHAVKLLRQDDYYKQQIQTA